MENTCEHCRHWAPNVNNKRRISDMAACKNPLLNQPAYEIIDNPSAAGADEGGHFLTGAKFGCVHFDPHAAPRIPDFMIKDVFRIPDQ